MQPYDALAKGPREIVTEYERIQLIRKRAVTEVAYCNDCNSDADFVSISDAAEIFAISRSELGHFIDINNCHYRTAANRNIQLCLTSLLTCIKTKTLNQQIKMIGD